MRELKPWLIACVCLLLWCCGGGGGCPAQAGGPCDPNEEQCQYGYYCAAAGVCTKRCTAEAECQEGRRCSVQADCLAGEDCKEGLCGEVLACTEGHCRLPCLESGTCFIDPYGPWSREGDPREDEQ